MAESTPEDGQNFSQLVEGLVSLAQSKTKYENSDILRDVIKSHIKTWLDQVENINPLYKVSELIPVGSYAEGTKILQPDEFDYLVVIEEFSKQDMIEIDADERAIQSGLVQVVVKNEELKSKCSGLGKGGYLKCFQPISFPEPTEERFGHIFIEAIWTIVKRSKERGHVNKSPNDIECRILLPTVNNVSLYFKGAEFRAPNVYVKFEYETMEVTVDISPAIRYHKIHDCFRENDCAGPAFTELVLSRKSLLLVGTSTESDFKLTVTEAEVEYIQTVMKAEHKIIYIFLKYIVKLFNELGSLPFSFTSYMMKTICIHHDMKCKKNEGSIKKCFKSVIDDLIVCQQQTFVVSIVNRHIRLFQRYALWLFVECLPRGMRRMCNVDKDIKTLEAFNSFLKRIVQEEHQERSEAKENWFTINTLGSIEGIQTELNEDSSKSDNMGFENYEHDSEQALLIMQSVRKALKRRMQEIYQEGRSSTNKEIPVQNSQPHSVNEGCHPSSGETRLVIFKGATTEGVQGERNEEDAKAMNGERQKLNQEPSSATSQEIPVDEKCNTYCRSEGPSNTVCWFQGQNSHSEQCPLELNCSQNTATYEILYQREKHT